MRWFRKFFLLTKAYVCIIKLTTAPIKRAIKFAYFGFINESNIYPPSKNIQVESIPPPADSNNCTNCLYIDYRIDYISRLLKLAFTIFFFDSFGCFRLRQNSLSVTFLVFN